LLDSTNTLNPIDLDIYRKYVGRIVRLFEIEFNEEKNYDLSSLINNVSNAYLEYDYKQAIYLIGEMVNEILKQKKLNKKEALIILKLLYPLTPFVCEELYSEYITKKNILSFEEWPNVD
jgi:leucyl-tRNA synthetase